MLLINKLATIVVKFLLIFRVVHNIPDKAIVLLLKFFKYLFASIGNINDTLAKNKGANMPLSIHGCYSSLGIKKLHLESIWYVLLAIYCILQMHFCLHG